MRKISKLAARAFIEGREFHRDNTSVRITTSMGGFRSVEGAKRTFPNSCTVQLRLHDNLIAERVDAATIHEKLRITLAGWGTPTTRERLNGLLTEMGKREGIWQHNHEQYYGTHEDNRVISSSEWITVT
jgi:hypothetical protein